MRPTEKMGRRSFYKEPKITAGSYRLIVPAREERGHCDFGDRRAQHPGQVRPLRVRREIPPRLYRLTQTSHDIRARPDTGAEIVGDKLLSSEPGKCLRQHIEHLRHV